MGWTYKSLRDNSYIFACTKTPRVIIWTLNHGLIFYTHISVRVCICMCTCVCVCARTRVWVWYTHICMYLWILLLVTKDTNRVLHIMMANRGSSYMNHESVGEKQAITKWKHTENMLAHTENMLTKCMTLRNCNKIC